MKRAQATKQLLRQLGSAPALVEDAERARARRAKTVERMTELMRREAKRQARRAEQRRWVGWLAWAAAAALVIGASWWTLYPGPGPDESPPEAPGARVTALAGSVSIARSGRTTETTGPEGVPLRLSDEVRTGPAGEARVTLGSGAVAQVGHETRLRLSPAEDGSHGYHEQLDLAVGRVELAVPKLAGEDSLSVHTPHATVLVRGTKFSVEVLRSAEGGELWTEVSVTEGAVVVRSAGRQARLAAGARWSSDTRRMASAAAPERTTDAPSTELGANDGSGLTEPVTPAAESRPEPEAAGTDQPREPSSTLAEENRLYAKALAARERGDDRAMVAHLDELVRRYPQSTLVPTAKIERSRARKRLGQSGAGTAPGQP